MPERKNEYVIITGAASDIGAAIARELSEEYNLILTDINEEALKVSADGCCHDADVKLLTMKLDRPDEIENVLTDYIAQNSIVISKYVHCAGIAQRVPVKMAKAEHYMTAFAVNVVSSAIIIKVLTSRKNKKALNSCVLFASTAAIRGVKTFSVYGSTKSAVLGLVSNLAIELAPSCRVNAISPGAVRTRATAELMDDRMEELQFKYPLGTGNPSRLTGTVKFLLSDESEWITGQNIVVDGGRTIDGTD